MEKQTTPFAHLAYIDALRGLAILGVLMVHASINGLRYYPDWVGEIFYEGSRGVQLFYVVSAFTLFMSFHHRGALEKYPLRNFFLRRFFRIAPMYYVAMAYYLWYDGLGPKGWLGDAPGISALNIAANATFLHSLSPYWINSIVPGGWSVAVEMLFYLMVPFLFYKVTTLNRAILFLIISLLVKVLLQAVFTAHPLIGVSFLWRHYLYMYFPAQLPIFGFGMIAYFWIVKGDRQINKWLLLAFVATLILQAVFCDKYQRNHIAISGYGIVFLGLVLLLSKIPYKIIVNRFFIYLGKVSYSAYLINWGVLQIITDNKAKFNLLDLFKSPLGIYPYLNFFTRLAIFTLIVMLIATVFWHLIEKPFQRLGKKLIARWEVEVQVESEEMQVVEEKENS